MRRALLLVGLLSTACQAYPFIGQEGETIGVTRKDVTINVPSKSDILFVIDNSASMAPKIAKLKAQVGEFVSSLFATGNTFRIGITTVDQQEPTPGGPAGNCASPPNPTPGADLIFNGVCGHLLAPAGAAGFLDSTDFTTAKAMSDTVESYLSNVNTIGSSWEQPIRGAWLALDPANAAPGKPDGKFIRPDALLVILILTDESDCSFAVGNGNAFIDPTIGAGDACYTNLNGLIQPDDWAQKIVLAKGGDARNVAVGVISGSYRNSVGELTPGPCINVPNPPANTPDYAAECYGFIDDPFFDNFSPNGKPGDPQCLAEGNNRLFDFSAQFSNVRDSICRTDYSQAMLQLANLADRQCFPLDAPPVGGDPANISISLERAGDNTFADVPFTTDASGATSGWIYSADPSPQVCLEGTWKRKKGDTVRLFVFDTQKTDDSSAPTAR